MTISFTVIGVPAPQGSKTKWGTEENPHTRPWRATVAAAADDAMNADLNGALYSAPVIVSAAFYFPRPKHHYRTGRHAGELKPGAPRFCATTPDLDKLQRAIGDALKGVVLRDDSLIVKWNTAKLYGEPARAEINVQAA